MASYHDAVGELELRASDLDRERAAAVLNRAVADGRLDWTEHGERLAGVYAAKTVAQLDPLLSDLPTDPQRGLSRPAFAALQPSSAGPLRVTLSKVRRTAEPNTWQRVRATLGAAVIDLRGLSANCTVELRADSLLGKVEVLVPPGTRLVDTGTAWLGKRSTVDRRRGDRHEAPRPDAPVVRIGGHSVLGHVRVIIA